MKFRFKQSCQGFAIWFLCTPILWATEINATNPEEPQAEPTYFAVLAFRPKPETRQRWQPIVDYLNSLGLKHHFVLEALTYSELEDSVRRKHADIVLTQPAHYIHLAYRENLYSPLATLIEQEGTTTLSNFGGVVFTSSARQDIRSYSDLRGKRIAASKKESLGGYQAQAFELLQSGVDPEKEIVVLETGMPHDKVIQSVLAGNADAGFVRTGVLEHMSREGKLDLSKLKTISPPALPQYPLALSTRLYPEWALAAMPWVDQDLAREVAAAMLSLEHDGKVAKAAAIHGFTIPGNYQVVEQMMRALHAPPFEKSQNFSLSELWEQHHATIAKIMLILSLVPTILFILLLRTNRRLRVQHEHLNSTNQALHTEMERRQEAELSLRTTHERLAEVDRINAVGQLAAGVVHEVKNPLTIIRFGIEYLANSKCPDAHQPEVINDIKDAVKRADHIVHGLLDYARNNDITLKQIDLNAILEKSIHLIRHHLDTHRIDVVRNFDPSLPSAIGDAERLTQVFVNLLMNAAQAIGQDGRITVSSDQAAVALAQQTDGALDTQHGEGEQVIQVEVRDTGPGLTEEALGQLFTPFFSTKPSGEGHGLGLSVAQDIIHLHDGKLDIMNLPEGGACARVTLRL